MGCAGAVRPPRDRYRGQMVRGGHRPCPRLRRFGPGSVLCPVLRLRGVPLGSARKRSGEGCPRAAPFVYHHDGPPRCLRCCGREPLWMRARPQRQHALPCGGSGPLNFGACEAALSPTVCPGAHVWRSTAFPSCRQGVAARFACGVPAAGVWFSGWAVSSPVLGREGVQFRTSWPPGL